MHLLELALNLTLTVSVFIWQMASNLGRTFCIYYYGLLLSAFHLIMK